MRRRNGIFHNFKCQCFRIRVSAFWKYFNFISIRILSTPRCLHPKRTSVLFCLTPSIMSMIWGCSRVWESTPVAIYKSCIMYIYIYICIIYMYIRASWHKKWCDLDPNGDSKNIERFTLYQNNLAMDNSPFKWQSKKGSSPCLPKCTFTVHSIQIQHFSKGKG